MREMKDSGIEWIGEIPKDWEIIKNKYLLNDLYSGGTPTSSNETFYDNDGTPFVSISDMSSSEYIYETKKGLSQKGIDDKNLRVLDKGTILYSIYATIGAVSELRINATISQAMLALDINGKVYKPFYKYSLKAMRDYIYFTANGNTQFNLNASKVINFYLVIPSLSEQQRIADFLDAKCAEIDNVINKSKNSIEEYKKLKQSVITQAVTKGIRPNRLMKDSGIEWIGEIPAEWETVKLGNIFSFLGGYAYNSEQFVDNNLNQVIRIGNVKNYHLNLEKSPVYINGETAKLTEKFRIKKNYILFTMTGTKGKRDYFFTYMVKENDIEDINLFLNQRVGCLISRESVCPCYYDYLLKTDRILDSIFLYETGTANQGNLGIETIRRTKLQYPTLSEQQEIADYLDEKCSAIDELIAKKEQFIVEMENYKKSLIYEYVTGKKEVQ